MDGILVIDKPSGWTSQDVVAKIRGLTRQRRVGHAGTLDPMATGVLVVCMGRATRVSEYLMASDKTYRAVVRLGIETDTYDADGQVVAQREVQVMRADLDRALAGLTGAIDQVPPMYSAIKLEGKPLYKLARKGIEVERAPRRITIHEIAVRAWEPPDATLDVRCSPGTYIRSIAHDLGQALPGSCGAHLVALTRLASGSFSVEEAVPLAAFQAAAADSTWTRWLRPMDAGLDRLPAVHLSGEGAQHVVNGQTAFQDGPREATGPVRAYDPAGNLIALVTYDPDTGGWRPHKVLAGPL